MRKSIADLDGDKEAEKKKVGSRKRKSPTLEPEQESDDEEDSEEDLEDEPALKRRFVFQGVVI